MYQANRVSRWVVTLTALLILIAGGFATRSVQAQQSGTPTPIAIGDTAEGNIDDTNFQIVYALNAQAGNAIVVSMSGGGGLDSYLYLKDANDKTLAEDDDSGGAGDALLKYTFTESGTYTLIATRSGGRNGRSSGSYRLRVTPGAGTKAATGAATQAGTGVAVALASPVATQAASTATPTATTAATTTAVGVAEVVTMPATAAATSDVITESDASATPTAVPSNTPRPTRTLRPTLTRTATPLPGEGTEAAQPSEPSATAAAPTASVRATRTPRPTLTRRPASPTPTPSPFVEGGEIVSGVAVKGTIDDARIFWVYVYQGTAGDQLNIALDGAQGLVPSIIVASADVQNADGPLKTLSARAGTSKLVMDVTLPTDGNYFVVATRAGTRQGTSSGAFSMTVQVTSFPAEIQGSLDPATAIKNLQAAKLVPDGGKLLFRMPTGTFARTSSAPGQTVPVGNNLQATDFVLQFQVSWSTAGEASGCGLTFRKNGSRDTSFVLLTNDGKIGVLQRQGTRALINYFAPSDLFTPKQLATVTVIAIQDKVTVYVNDKFVTSERGRAVRGQFEASLFNVDGNTTLTYCLFPSGWVWTYDK